LDDGSAVRSHVYDLLREARRHWRAGAAECGVEYGGIGSLAAFGGDGHCAGNRGGGSGGGGEEPSLEARFRLGTELGRGHFGVVRLCEDRRTGERFACKTALKSQITTSEAMRELRAEVLIPLLLQAARGEEQAHAARGVKQAQAARAREGGEASQAGKQAGAGRSKGWKAIGCGEGTGKAARGEEGEAAREEQRSTEGGHGGRQGEYQGRGVSAARCLKFVRITDVADADRSTADADCYNEDENGVGSTKGSEYAYKTRNEVNKNEFVRLVDVFEDHSAVHLVMEYCEGGDLFDHVARHERLDERQTCHILRQLAAAVARMHERGIVHRDLKPENILLTSRSSYSNSNLFPRSCCHMDSGEPSDVSLCPSFLSANSLTAQCIEVKIADFGLARVLQRGCRLHGMVGSPFYMAPETVRGREYGEEVDVWSLGVIMYTCLSGTLPFYGKNQNAVFAAVCRGEVDLETGQPWTLISHEAKELIRRMLDADPNQRIRSSSILHHPWFELQHQSERYRQQQRQHCHHHQQHQKDRHTHQHQQHHHQQHQQHQHHQHRHLHRMGQHTHQDHQQHQHQHQHHHHQRQQHQQRQQCSKAAAEEANSRSSTSSDGVISRDGNTTSMPTEPSTPSESTPSKQSTARNTTPPFSLLSISTPSSPPPLSTTSNNQRPFTSPSAPRVSPCKSFLSDPSGVLLSAPGNFHSDPSGHSFLAPGAFPVQCSLTEVKASQSQRRGRFMIFSAPSSPVPVAGCKHNLDGVIGGVSGLSLSSEDGSVDKVTESGVWRCSPQSVLDGANFGM
ncbi:hypothetical protein CLOM_g20169, partial [Closterium sp. NIES-68]